MKIHSGEKPNKCNQCDYASSQADNLRSHLKKHIEEKSNKCNQCKFGCSDPSSLRSHMKLHSGGKSNKCNQCTMCTLDSFFSFRPRAVGHIVQPRDCHIIEHLFVPTLSVERNNENEKIRFPWASNSKFVIFPQIFPCSNYKICPIIPPLALVIPL